MTDQNAVVADASTNGDAGGTSGTVREDSMDIEGDFFSRQLAVKGLTSFDLMQHEADTADRYLGDVKVTLTKSSLKRSDALTAPKINLC